MAFKNGGNSTFPRRESVAALLAPAYCLPTESIIHLFLGPKDASLTKVLLPVQTPRWAPTCSTCPSSHIGADYVELVQGRDDAVLVPEGGFCQLKLIARQKAKDGTRSNNIGQTGVVMQGGRGAAFTSTAAEGFPGEHVIINFYS
jgi:hypothetical protein